MSAPSTMKPDAAYPWSIAILSSRESPEVLAATIEAAVAAIGDRAATLDVMINGSAALAEATGRYATTRSAAHTAKLVIRVWYIAKNDKSNAWNCYLYDIWPGGDPAFFVDGYARVQPDALQLIADGLAGAPTALAGSAVPTVGRSAKALREQMLREGGAHGNLYALRATTMARLRTSGFRLPLGLYYTDPLLQSAICFDLDPARRDWDWSRIFVHPRATWTFRPLDWRRPSDLWTHLKRTVRQAQGQLEAMAYNYHYVTRRAAPETLPETAARMVSVWRAARPGQARQALLRNPMLLLGLHRLRRMESKLSGTLQSPRLVGQWPSDLSTDFRLQQALTGRSDQI
jgi:hypothetical protein